MEQRGDAPPIAATGARATARGLLAILEDVPIGSRRSKKLARQEKCAPVGAPSRLLFRLFNARLATARLIDQCGLTALAVLTAPSLDRRLAGNLVLDHGLANRQAVFQTVLNHSELYVVRIGVMMRTGIENGVGTAHGIRAGPLTSRGLGNAKLRGEGAMTDPLLKDLDGALPNLGRMRASPSCFRHTCHFLALTVNLLSYVQVR